MSLADLPNLGPKSAEMLEAAGLVTKKQLENAGAVAAFLAVRQSGANPSLNLLWAIAGALKDTHWTNLSLATKQRLLDELQAVE